MSRRPAPPLARPRAPRLPESVLFACSRNALRSPMAEAMLKTLHPNRVYVDSVGVRVMDIDGFAVAAMAEIGVDLTRHQAKTFDDMDDAYFDLIITLSPEAQHRAVEMTRTMACEVEFWNTLDPSIVQGSRETRLDAYRQVRDALFERIRTRFPAPEPVSWAS